MLTKLKNAVVITLNKNNEIIENGTVIVENEKIISLENNEKMQFDKIIDCGGNMIMPSLFNGFVSFDAPYETEIKSLIINGVNNICYFGRISNEFLTYVKTNKLNVIAAINLNKITDLTENAITEEINKLDNVCLPALYISDVLNFMDNEFDTVIKYVKKFNTLLMCNVSNNLTEVGICHNEVGSTPIGLLESFGILDLKPILTPCTSIDKEDIDILKNYEASVILTPANEMFKGNGIAPLTTILHENINAGLGTVKNNNLFNELRFCGLIQSGLMCAENVIPEIELLKMVTINGTTAFNLNNNAISIGNNANLIVVKKPNNILTLKLLKPFIYSENKQVLLNLNNGEIVHNIL